jgi:Putative Flp pilus-assembly TadE/G-like
MMSMSDTHTPRFARSDGRQSGQILVVVVLGLFVLIAAAALAVDGGRTFEERRAAQTAVDHAASAAAFAGCGGADLATAQAAGRLAAARNGFDDAAAAVAVTITQVGIPSDYTYRAAISSQIPGTFARIVGMNTFTIGVEATAAGTGCGATTVGSSPGAIFAGGNTCTGGKYGVDISGSNDEVFGGIHSNSDAHVGGTSNDFDDPDPAHDPWTYIGSMTQGSGNEYQTGYPQDLGPLLPTPQWPAGWAPADVGSAGSPPPAGSLLRAYYDLADANGSNDTDDTLFTDKVTAVTKDGVYYTSSSDGMDISASPGVRKVVLVAPNGPIKVSGSGVTWTAITDAEIDALPGMGTGANLALNLPRPGVLMLSNYQWSGIDKCDKFTIAISGSNSDWNGILWAPGGLIEMSGSSNVASFGSLIGWAVRLNGSDLVIRFDSNLFPTAADPSILLLE